MRTPWQPKPIGWTGSPPPGRGRRWRPVLLLALLGAASLGVVGLGVDLLGLVAWDRPPAR
jgi:hypothetical protein